MPDPHRIDWNLVPVLNALLRERNVSRAARSLGISQSAASGALARLRRHFNDDLLLRRGNNYELSPTGQLLAPLARNAADAALAVATATRSFDALRSDRVFNLASTGYGQTVMGGPLAARIRSHAPQVRLVFTWPANPGGATSDWLADVDGWLGPRDALPGLSSSGLLRDEWVCVVDGDNASVGARLAMDEVADHGWVVPTRPKDGDLPWRQRAFAHGVDLPIAVSTESFSSVPFLVSGTPFVGIMRRRLALLLEAASGVRILPCPWSMLPLNLTLWWHQNRENDAAHAWLRDQVIATMDTLDVALLSSRQKET